MKGKEREEEFKMEKPESFSKYEKARILGARALQISMDAPILMKISKEKLEELNFDPLKIAEIEFESEVLPITIKRPLPGKTKEKIEKMKLEEEIADESKIKKEKEEEKEITEEGEIMALAKPEDESGEGGEKPEEEKEI
jgi:DNA-directed RNA polymerase subunit K